VISAQTSREITDMLTTTMATTYTRFAIPGYDVAAKTGTAQIPLPSGGYDPDPHATIGSVVGYGPSQDPQFTVLVKIERPQNADWGEEAAGPAFQQVMQQLFLLKGIPPTNSTTQTPTSKP